ncbi:MAG: hypothetical protein UV73_C0003G0126 [Candidatus Gottesmanbacteria bacterium GW2011_GWA2_43_14]|uniref:General secretion pathway GspH domain-containing protein n=1 Tax=Candidatus Gottesmanbacteria bacterium GW2011_GWA2_43_14 TaxID=1618443 RepID=A0A0G1DKL6_9BACT|nr:MAG: hypothetical protein UV73_C0003G0126 [Candidatus Gottesmanbacteria bacterium GW2011_GWA2_43_14]
MSKLKDIRPAQNGFSLIELTIVMSILILLYAVVSLNLSNARPRSSLNTQITTLSADLRQQQLKALSGQANGGTASEYGIYFSENSYTLFAGTSYSSSDPSNHVINLNDDLIFNNINLPQQSVIFSAGTGEAAVYDAGQNSVSLLNSVTNVSRMLTLNAWGTVISVN